MHSLGTALDALHACWAGRALLTDPALTPAPSLVVRKECETGAGERRKRQRVRVKREEGSGERISCEGCGERCVALRCVVQHCLRVGRCRTLRRPLYLEEISSHSFLPLHHTTHTASLTHSHCLLFVAINTSRRWHMIHLKRRDPLSYLLLAIAITSAAHRRTVITAQHATRE